MSVLPDGEYDAVVVDARTDGAAMSLDLALASGERTGEVVTVTAAGLGRDEIDLLGLPATLTVREGRPAVRIDD